MKKNYNIVNSREIINTLSDRLPHIQKYKIKLVYHLLQREIKITLAEGKTIKIGNFLSFKINQGYVKNFWCVFNKKIRNTIINTKIQCRSDTPNSSIKIYLSKGKVIENAETRGLRINQKYSYRTTQRALAKAKEGQKLR